MRNLEINKSTIYVLNYQGEEDVIDASGNYTGEKHIIYKPKKLLKTHLSGARGSSQSEIFGTDVRYDKTFILTKDEFKKYGITENTVFFINVKPTYKDDSPLYDYRVERIADTVNEVAIAITKVRR